MVAAPIEPRRDPFPVLPGTDELVESAELVLEQFTDRDERTPVTVVHPWQRQTPPPLPQSPEDG